jgi:hypothetical protein
MQVLTVSIEAAGAVVAAAVTRRNDACPSELAGVNR